MNMIGLPNHVKKAHEVGMDIMGATGYEAAGHTGEVGTIVAIPQIVDACRGLTSPLTKGPVHVVAAGGIYDGRTLAAVLNLGAEGAWVGTRLLASHESSPVKKADHMRNIIRAKSTDTVRTLIYSGRPLRVYKTEYVQSWENDSTKRMEIDRLTSSGVVPFRQDYKENVKAKSLAGDVGFEKGWSVAKNHRNLMGQASAAITSIKPAREIVEEMVADAAVILKGSGAKVTMLPDEPEIPDVEEEMVKVP